MKYILGLLIGFNAMAITSTARINDQKYLQGVRAPVNYIRNPSCLRNNLFITGTNTTITRSQASQLTEIADCRSILNSDTDIIDFSSRTFDASLKSGICEARADYRFTLVGGNTVEAQVRISGSTVASKNIVTAANGSFSIQFPCGDVTAATPTLRIAQTAGASSNTIFLANVFIGQATSIPPHSARINCETSPSISSENWDWLTSIGARSSRACVITINSGVFNEEPHCFLTLASATPDSVSILTSSATSITVYGPNADWTGWLTCMAAK